MEVEEAAEAVEEEVVKKVEAEEEEELHNRNNPSQWPKTSELWDLRPPSTTETEPKLMIGLKS